MRVLVRCDLRNSLSQNCGDKLKLMSVKERTSSLGELERSTMECVWDSPAGLTATAIRDTLADRDLALTTVHTVLSRLERKGFVSRNRQTRPTVYSATLSREDHMADLMTDVLDTAPDRHAVLARFVGSVSESDSQFLARLLGS